MKNITITALILLTLSAQAGVISSVRTDKQRATIEARVDAQQELLVFIGDESLGWSAAQPTAEKTITAIVKTSSQIRLEGGSKGKGFTFQVGGSTAYVAITPDGPVPFGEFVIRADSKVASKNGTFTFADIRKPDNTLVPVSVRVRTVQPPVN